MDTAQRWGLPAGFTPVRFPISDDVKSLVRELLAPNEPVIATIANDEGTVSVIATPERLFTVKSGASGAGVTGYNTKEFPWEGITKLVLQPMSMNVTFRIDYKTSGGGKVETGLRAKMGKDASDKVMPFDTTAGTQFFEAIEAIWQHKTAQATSE